MPRTNRSKAQHRLIPAVLALSLLALGGCANRPSAVGFMPSAQQKLQSAGHWQVVANDVASAVSTHLRRQTEMTGGDPERRDPVSVVMGKGTGSVFGEGLSSSLQTAFVQLGHPVAVRARDGAVTVGIDMMVVRHQPGRGPAWTAPGPLTILGAGAAVGAFMLDNFPWGVTAVPLGLGADALLAKPTETDTELMLTVSIERDGYQVFRSAAVYYIDGRDSGVYEAEGSASRTLNDVPQGTVYYDIAKRPYVLRDRR